MEETLAATALWRTLADRALKGAPFDSLRKATPDGLLLEPFYPAAPPVYSGRAEAGRWSVVERVASEAALARAPEALQLGADGLELVWRSAPLAFGEGLAIDALDALEEGLSGVMIEHCPLWLGAGADAIGSFALIAALCERRGVLPRALNVGLDPAGTLFATGATSCAEPAELADAARVFLDRGFSGTLFAADGRPVAEAGATPAQELAFALASLTTYLRALDGEGIGPAEALPLLALCLSADQDQFATIAKLRAARRLYTLIASSCGAPSAAVLHVTTSWRMLSASDPHTNLLRLTSAAFSAGVAGADAVTVLPFDCGLEDGSGPFAARMARNIQALLLEEAHLDALADPAAGAGAIEAETDALARAAWALFQTREADHLERIAAGGWAEDVAASAERARLALEKGERAIIGVTRHPPPNPRPVPPPPGIAEQPCRADGVRSMERRIALAADGASLADLCAPAERTAPPRPPARLSASHEASPNEG